MMIKPVTIGLVTLALALPMAVRAGADSDSDRSSPKTFVKDTIITTKIKAKLAEEKLASLMHITVDTDDAGTVSLSGKAASREEADKAVAIAREVDGVVSVENNIQIEASR